MLQRGRRDRLPLAPVHGSQLSARPPRPDTESNRAGRARLTGTPSQTATPKHGSPPPTGPSSTTSRPRALGTAGGGEDGAARARQPRRRARVCAGGARHPLAMRDCRGHLLQRGLQARGARGRLRLLRPGGDQVEEALTRLNRAGAAGAGPLGAVGCAAGEHIGVPAGRRLVGVLELGLQKGLDSLWPPARARFRTAAQAGRSPRRVGRSWQTELCWL